MQRGFCTRFQWHVGIFYKFNSWPKLFLLDSWQFVALIEPFSLIMPLPPSAGLESPRNSGEKTWTFLINNKARCCLNLKFSPTILRLRLKLIAKLILNFVLDIGHIASPNLVLKVGWLVVGINPSLWCLKIISIWFSEDYYALNFLQQHPSSLDIPCTSNTNLIFRLLLLSTVAIAVVTNQLDISSQLEAQHQYKP